MSGHIFFADRYFGFDDAVYAGARLLELLERAPSRRWPSSSTRCPSSFTTPEIRATCPDDDEVRGRARAQRRFRERYDVVDIDGVRMRVRTDGWGLVRASNTQPVLVLRFEADNNERLEEIKALVEGRLAQIMSEMGAPPPKSPRTSSTRRSSFPAAGIWLSAVSDLSFSHGRSG